MILLPISGSSRRVNISIVGNSVQIASGGEHAEVNGRRVQRRSTRIHSEVLVVTARVSCVNDRGIESRRGRISARNFTTFAKSRGLGTITDELHKVGILHGSKVPIVDLVSR